MTVDVYLSTEKTKAGDHKPISSKSIYLPAPVKFSEPCSVPFFLPHQKPPPGARFVPSNDKRSSSLLTSWLLRERTDARQLLAF